MINRLSVTQKLVLSFAFVIIVGSILLSLPISHYANSPETSYLDHLFNAVSMVCVTGLSVVPVSKAYNGFGQIISILLIQTGGLGLVSLIAFSTYTLKNKLGLSDQDVETACKKVTNGFAVPANYNCPGQVVVSGNRNGITELTEIAKEMGISRSYVSRIETKAISKLSKEIKEKV